MNPNIDYSFALKFTGEIQLHIIFVIDSSYMIYPSSSDKRDLYCGAIVYRLIKIQYPHNKTLLDECATHFNLDKTDDTTLISLTLKGKRRIRIADTMGVLLTHFHALARADRFPSTMVSLEAVSDICYTAKTKHYIKGLSSDIEALRKRWLEFNPSLHLCYAFSARKRLLEAKFAAGCKGPGIGNPVNVVQWWANNPHTFMAEAMKVKQVVIPEIQEAMVKHCKNKTWYPSRFLNSVFYTGPNDRPLPDIDARIIILDSDLLNKLLNTPAPVRN